MGWLDNLEYDHLYCCECGQETVTKEKTDSITCDCGKVAPYSKMLPMELGLSGKVSYDQNGRKAYVLQGKNGRRPTYISATKMHYLNTGEVKPQYTAEYERKVAKESPEYLEGDTNMNRAKARKYRGR